MAPSSAVKGKRGATCAEMIALLEANLLNMTELYLLLAKMSGGELKPWELKKQIQGSIVIPAKSDGVFGVASDISQCVACGAMRVVLPKMLTCGRCKGYHYCSKVCQKKDWKLSHKHTCTDAVIDQAHFKTTDICMKMLSVMCIDWDSGTMNGENNFVQEKIEKFGFKDCVYVPVYDKKRLWYIPMPLKTLTYVNAIIGKDAALKSSIDTAHAAFESSEYIVLFIPTKVQGCSIMVKETFVLLPWASK